MKKITSIALACLVTISPLTYANVQASDGNNTPVVVTDESNTTNKTKTTIKYKTKTIDKSKEFKGSKSSVMAEYTYKRIVLKGKSKAIKKINKRLKKYCTSFFTKDKNQDLPVIFEYAKDASESRDYNDSYCDSVTQQVSFVNKKYICISASSHWYAGGVTNSSTIGYTFNLKTGKQVKKITSFTKTKSLKKIKQQLVQKINEKDAGYTTTEIADKGSRDFDFIIDKDGNVVVCFGPYELGYGGFTKFITLDGKFKK